MDNTAVFCFYGNLTDLLPIGRGNDYQYFFNGKPSIKDAVEAIGIPHTEVDVIMVNLHPVNFDYQLQNGDCVSVYPFGSELSAQYSIAGEVPVQSGFIADVHLGTLARTLRMLGFDTLYDSRFTEADIASVATSQNRVILTRSVNLLKLKNIRWGYWLRSPHAETHALEVIKRYHLQSQIEAFKRCMVCNGLLQSVSKQDIVHILQPKTKQYFNDFWQCCHCRRVYWKGSHYEHMRLMVDRIKAADL